MQADSLVSCLCVTRNRVPLLRRSVACFQEQTYAARELLIQYEADDAATRRYVATLDDPRIRGVEIPDSPRLRLGERRNLAIAASRGRYIAQWDDDDWHGPTRLAEQIAALRDSAKPGCVLWRVVLFDTPTGRGYISEGRPCEGTLVAERDKVPAFADLGRGEDEHALRKMIEADELAALDRPLLYVYVYHGSNTSGRTHFKKRLFAHATLLGAEDTRKIAADLAAGSAP